LSYYCNIIWLYSSSHFAIIDDDKILPYLALLEWSLGIPFFTVLQGSGNHAQEDPPMDDYTRRFNVVSGGINTREILSTVYEALRIKGYNPVNQIVGYILSEDPTYITNYNNARSLICKLDRDELLQELVTSYLGS